MRAFVRCFIQLEDIVRGSYTIRILILYNIHMSL